MRRVRLAVLADDLDDAHLQQLIHTRNLVEHLNDPLDRLRHGAVREEDERIPLARRVGLGREERLDELGRIGDQVLELAVDGVDREDGVLADVGVSMFEAGAADWDEGFEDFDVFGDLLEEPERCTTDVFVRMLLEK